MVYSVDNSNTQISFSGAAARGALTAASDYNWYLNPNSTYGSGHLYLNNTSAGNVILVRGGGSVGVNSSTPVATLAVTGSSSLPSLYVASSSGASQLVVAASGNLGIGTTTPTLGPLTMASGAYVTAGGTWTNASDRNLKENFATMTPADILQKIDQLPITEWNYKTEGPLVKHIGPIAQDFFALFQVGNSSTSISTIDPGGVALLGIQALSQKIAALQGSLSGNASSSNLSVYIPSNFSGDSVGEAKILAGQTSIRVSFRQTYSQQPVVTFSPEGAVVPAFIQEKDAAGFTLAMPSATTTDVTFDWHSFASPQARLTVSDGTTQPIQLVITSTPAATSPVPAAAQQIGGSSPLPQANTSSTAPTVLGTSTPTTSSAPAISTPAQTPTSNSTTASSSPVDSPVASLPVVTAPATPPTATPSPSAAPATTASPAPSPAPSAQN
jgi:hypothetical protein